MSTGTRWINRICCWAVTLVLAVTLFAACAASLASLLLTNGTFHGWVAADSGLVDQQMARIQGKIRQLGEKTPFDADAVMAAITREEVAAYGRQARDWWMQLYLPNPKMLAPVLELPSVEEALANDPVFRATQTDTTYKGAIRDDVMPGIVGAVREAVLPLRVELISFGLSKMLERFNVVQYISLLEWVPLLLWVLAFLAADLLLILCYRRGREGWMYVGWGISAAGLGLLTLVAALASWQLPALLREGNALLGLQGDLLVRNTMILTVALTLLMAGAGTWLVHFSAACRKESHGHPAENQPV